MNRKKQILICLLTILLCALTLLTACGEEKLLYQVSVADALGTPYTKGVTVKFMQDGEQVGLHAVNKDGVAEIFLPGGNYTVSVQFTDPETVYSYDKTDLTLSESKTQLAVTANPVLGEKSESLFVGEAEYAAHFVDVGCTEFALNAEEMTYFLFAPAQAGKYECSLVGTDAAIGYYGFSYFALQESVVPTTDKTLSVSFREEEVGEGAFPVVLGVPAGEGKAVLTISRVADVEKTGEMPWNTDWQTGHQDSDSCRVELPEKLKYFDITAKSGKYDLFYDEAAGCYRTKENGPVVLVALGKNNNPKCQCVGLFERVNGNGMYGGSNVVRYFYNEDKKLVKREKYTDALLEIFDHSGITAYDQEVYHPLTKDLMYVLQNGFASWWDPESPDFQEAFVDANPEYAWLFACCYER